MYKKSYSFKVKFKSNRRLRNISLVQRVIFVEFRLQKYNCKQKNDYVLKLIEYRFSHAHKLLVVLIISILFKRIKHVTTCVSATRPICFTASFFVRRTDRYTAHTSYLFLHFDILTRYIQR